MIKTNTFGNVGLGFADRSDAFDLNVALQDHFKSLRLEEQIQKESEEPAEKLDLALKAGQTIKVNINIPSKGSSRHVWSHLNLAFAFFSSPRAGF